MRMIQSILRTRLRTTSFKLISWVGKAIALSALLAQISRERRSLARLSADQLRDIGVSRKSAERESSRSVFEIPPNRLKRERSARSPWTSGEAARTAPRQSVPRSR